VAMSWRGNGMISRRGRRMGGKWNLAEVVVVVMVVVVVVGLL